ncbi:MAG: phytoene/squalene synthase family protein [Gammaproteobacteria bacterium]
MNKNAAAHVSADEALSYQDRILSGVSRTFALTIPQLPEALRIVVANAYLLCRIADTIEDEQVLSAAEKQYFHALFVRVVNGTGDATAFSCELAPLLVGRALPAEKELVSNTPAVIRVTQSFNPRQRTALTHCISIMCEGMPRYERNASVNGLTDLRELDRYCYFVAGIVGETLTELFCEYSPEIARQREAMASLGVSFGQGLQMTNILKDFWEDHDRGVCWLPRDIFERVGVKLEEVRRDHIVPGFQQAYANLVSLAHSHLRNALDYTLLIPDKEVGLRRFCLIAIGLAMRTLQSINDKLDFTAGNQVKVSRRVVKKIVIVTHLFASYDRVLKRWFVRLGKNLPFQAIAADWVSAIVHGHDLSPLVHHAAGRSRRLRHE